MATKEAKQEEDGIYIARLKAATLLIPIKGTTPLIVHNFSQKSKQMMLDSQQGKKTPKEKRDPHQEFSNSLYRLEGGGYGFPASGFKAATVGAARFYGKTVITMTDLRQFLFFHGIVTPEDPQILVQIHGEPQMREDVVRIGKGVADLRYRAEFREWSAVLQVTYMTNALARDSVISLVNAGGMGCGIGEWRPQKNGQFGTYEVDTTKEIQKVELTEG